MLTLGMETIGDFTHVDTGTCGHTGLGFHLMLDDHL